MRNDFYESIPEMCKERYDYMLYEKKIACDLPWADDREECQPFLQCYKDLDTKEDIPWWDHTLFKDEIQPKGAKYQAKVTIAKPGQSLEEVEKELLIQDGGFEPEKPDDNYMENHEPKNEVDEDHIDWISPINPVHSALDPKKWTRQEWAQPGQPWSKEPKGVGSYPENLDDIKKYGVGPEAGKDKAGKKNTGNKNAGKEVPLDEMLAARLHELSGPDAEKEEVPG